MNNDIIRLIALKSDICVIRNLVVVNRKFHKVLNCKEFILQKISFDFPGIKEEWRTREFYFDLKKQLRESKFLPIIKCDNQYLILHRMFEQGIYKDLCVNNELIYAICNDKETFEKLFDIFFPYISGNYVKRKSTSISWPQFYSETIKDLSILKTGFLV